MFADWNEIRELLDRSPRPPGYMPLQGIDTAGAAALRAMLGSELPSDLSQWLHIANGLCAGPGGLFGFGTREEHLDMKFFWALFSGWRMKGWIPVAGDGCGNYYVLAIQDECAGSDPVLFVETLDNADAGSYVVASSLAHFLRFYLEDDIGRTGWPFDEMYVRDRDPAICNFGRLTLPWDARA
ncbi:SMI1/KNR4 family protein [Pseudoduganella sp. SL102]|uniref:SMI1/KNR4 family protein n=1 Tax=Pseudoduganella sp. SL102 TaxID=2995154 RepID=UPI00248C8988|nr:SMI1/KNR4 family protein [Pseudoduganella sp. SL102]WBS05571.1 SMI1/KNR4 family protein [Pseudoduganella sp. SL102]